MLKQWNAKFKEQREQKIIIVNQLQQLATTPLACSDSQQTILNQLLIKSIQLKDYALAIKIVKQGGQLSFDFFHIYFHAIATENKFFLTWVIEEGLQDSESSTQSFLQEITNQCVRQLKKTTDLNLYVSIHVFKILAQLSEHCAGMINEERHKQFKKLLLDAYESVLIGLYSQSLSSEPIPEHTISQIMKVIRLYLIPNFTASTRFLGSCMIKANHIDAFLDFLNKSQFDLLVHVEHSISWLSISYHLCHLRIFQELKKMILTDLSVYEYQKNLIRHNQIVLLNESLLVDKRKIKKEIKDEYVHQIKMEHRLKHEVSLNPLLFTEDMTIDERALMKAHIVDLLYISARLGKPAFVKFILDEWATQFPKNGPDAFNLILNVVLSSKMNELLSLLTQFDIDLLSQNEKGLNVVQYCISKADFIKTQLLFRSPYFADYVHAQGLHLREHIHLSIGNIEDVSKVITAVNALRVKEPSPVKIMKP